MTRFPKNARVCFLGDSITHGNNFVKRIIAYYKKNYPEDGVKFWNCGVSGGSTTSAQLYMEDDLLPHNPTHVAIMLGVNDSGRDLLAKERTEERDAMLKGAYDAYNKKMEAIVDGLLSRGIKVILCTPAPYAEFQKTDVPPLPGAHTLITRYAEAVRKLARSRGLDVVDYHARLSELYLDEELYGADHVHPNDMGHFRMAECFLWAQGEDPIPYEPIEEITKTAGLTEWADLVSKQRNIFAGEWMIVCNYSASYEEKMKIVTDYVNEKRWGDFQYFEHLSKDYQMNKPSQPAITARINEIMEHYYD